jgi:hypothetical protein
LRCEKADRAGPPAAAEPAQGLLRAVREDLDAEGEPDEDWAERSLMRISVLTMSSYRMTTFCGAPLE